jgi:stalled ribosome rescue protein Dom34
VLTYAKRVDEEDDWWLLDVVEEQGGGLKVNTSRRQVAAQENRTGAISVRVDESEGKIAA